MSVPELTWDQVLSWRMERHLLDRPAGLDPAAVACRLAGIQAQVASSAAQAVAVRRAERTDGVDDALGSRTLIRTWAMRGTLHLLRPADAAAFLPLIASARSWLTPPWQREFATAGQMDAIAEAVSAVLPGAELTREELASAVVEHSGDASLGEKLTSGWGALLKPMAWQGLLCNGTSRGGRVTFTTPSTWTADWIAPSEPDVAVRTALPAYLAAHGPAAPETFGQWLLRGALRRSVTRGWFTSLVDDGSIAPVRVDGETLHARTEDLDALAAAEPSSRVRLLPAFDQYVLGPGTGDTRILAPERRKLVSRAGGWIAPVVVVGGRVAGTWKVDGGSLDVELFSESDLVDRDALDAEADVLGDVLGVRLTPSITRV
ncbi:DNA glycosylase AlkZ-like family protein [Pseudonocardia endophytica]|uniref:Winged helix DNA-binding protein n=1 Tax=Pseudonocardia endophytica TaxID=401976 RepID=A0A4R1HPJ3_PSEEN|nr:crosslink repair DNA glycosylase YcaQ family protein [Pseudonocardia endophytica]TCK24477.1 winged helix DNA-binding protein [Pseudonocardia endophytica]